MTSPACTLHDAGHLRLGTMAARETPGIPSHRGGQDTRIDSDVPDIEQLAQRAFPLAAQSASPAAPFRSWSPSAQSARPCPCSTRRLWVSSRGAIEPKDRDPRRSSRT